MAASRGETVNERSFPAPVFAAPRAAYVHVPFCKRHCGYCNFTVIAGRDDLIDRYLEAIDRELSWLGQPREVDTLFFGGGTPSHLSAEALGRLFDCVQRWFPAAQDCEISIEANPADLDTERVKKLAALGVTRVSLGAQSFDDQKLQLLQRDHRQEDIGRSLRLARDYFASVAIDLIFAAPGETLDAWQADLDAALELEPDHISVYGLTFEQGTTFWNRRQHGQLRELDEELQRRMLLAAIDRLIEGGFEHYEISNYARPGHRCRHNQVYWRGQGYYAVGPGAARYVDGRRETNHRSTTTWLKRVLADESPVAETEQLEAEDRAREALVLGLRMLDGVDRDEFARRTGFELQSLAGDQVRRLVEWGLLEEQAGRVRLTREGLLVSDAIWSELLAGSSPSSTRIEAIPDILDGGIER